MAPSRSPAVRVREGRQPSRQSFTGIASFDLPPSPVEGHRDHRSIPFVRRPGCSPSRPLRQSHDGGPRPCQSAVEGPRRPPCRRVPGKSAKVEPATLQRSEELRHPVGGEVMAGIGIRIGTRIGTGARGGHEWEQVEVPPPGAAEGGVEGGAHRGDRDGPDAYGRAGGASLKATAAAVPLHGRGDRRRREGRPREEREGKGGGRHPFVSPPRG